MPDRDLLDWLAFAQACKIAGCDVGSSSVEGLAAPHLRTPVPGRIHLEHVDGHHAPPPVNTTRGSNKCEPHRERTPPTTAIPQAQSERSHRRGKKECEDRDDEEGIDYATNSNDTSRITTRQEAKKQS